MAAVVWFLLAPVLASASEVYVRVNQIGFGTADFKSAMVFGQQSLPDAFKIINANTGSAVFTGRINPVAGTWGQFDRHGEIDFSSLKSEGTYIIEAGAARSPHFQISRTANAEVPDQLLDFMRQQRCGYNPFVDAVCHTFDGRTAFGPERRWTTAGAAPAQERIEWRR